MHHLMRLKEQWQNLLTQMVQVRLFTENRGVHMGITEPTAIIWELSHLKTLASFGAVLCSVN
jgi:hypothetical protein